MSDFADDLFKLGAKITKPLTSLELQTRQQKFDYIANLSGKGATNLRIEDAKPLEAGVKKVFDIMGDGKWYSIPQLRELTGLEQPDRRMRALRERGYTVHKQRVRNSRSFEYRLGIDCKI